ncbi:MAG: cytochrome c [Chloroflexota bacterium]
MKRSRWLTTALIVLIIVAVIPFLLFSCGRDRDNRSETAPEPTTEAQVEVAEEEAVEEETVEEEAVEEEAAESEAAGSTEATNEGAEGEIAEEESTDEETTAADATEEETATEESDEAAKSTESAESTADNADEEATNDAAATQESDEDAEVLASVEPAEGNNPFQLMGRINPNITDGETLFIDNCARCHGLEGYGNGPSWDSLGAIKGNMTLIILDDQSDEQIFETISNGKEVEMPPWGLVMTEEQRWALVDYIRTLSISNQ